MRKNRLLVLLTLICIVALLLPLTVSAAEATVPDGFSENGMNYYRDGQMVCDEIIEVDGKYYAFDATGWLYNGQEFYLNGWHRAKEDGTLYVNEWYDGGWATYYYGEGGLAAQDFLKLDGTWYFFNSDGEQLSDRAVWSEAYQAWYALDQSGTSHKALGEGWTQAYGEWYYTEKVDGALQLARGVVKSLYQKAYGKAVPIAFNYSGQMVVNDTFWGDGVYRAGADGVLMTGWYEDEDGDWYYYGSDGKAFQDFQQVGGTWYYFEGDGRMAQDCYVWSSTYSAYYAMSADGEAHKKLSVEGWNYAYGEYYYMEMVDNELEPVYDRMVEDNGKQYYLDWNGQMVVGELVDYYDYDQQTWVYMVADSKGVLSGNGWYKEGNSWRYLQAGQQLADGVHEIDGKLYYFDWYDLAIEPGEHYNYYISENDGQLYRNQWRYCEITYPSEIGWVYYGDDGAMLQDTVKWIGGYYYGFNYNGVMLTDTIWEFDGQAYRFGSDGKGTKLTDNWYRHPANSEWMYVKDGALAEGIMAVNGVTYAFSEGYMKYNDWYDGEYNGMYGCYLFDGDGAMVTRSKTSNGWIQMGEWYYVENDNSLATGWKKSGGDWYYLTPAMVHDYIVYEESEQKCYVANQAGICTAISGTGLQTVDGYTVYLQNGKALMNSWKKVGGYWYYFGEGGFALKGTATNVGEERYLFDRYGKLQTGGWVNQYSDWYYADPSNDGALYTGLKTIGGAKYIFSEYGYMYSNELYNYEGTYYMLASDGHVTHTFTEGWNKANGEWYYLLDGSFLRDCTYEIGGKYYGFDWEGIMQSGCVEYTGNGRYVFAESGEILTGWHKLNGKWTYGDPENDMRAATGWLYLNGKEYLFSWDGYLQMGTFTWGRTIYTTDSDGAVIKETDVPDGWYYEDGNWNYYTEEDGYYTGWLGDYYIEDGTMRFNQFVEYNGKLYYLTANGLCLRNGWYETPSYDGWILARADGSLYCSQWVQKGGAWYYFNGYSMVEDTVREIDGKYHEFDEDGKWLGEYKSEDANVQYGLSDGWHKLSGKWYYYYAGVPCTGRMYIDGSWYFLDYATGAMAVNTLDGGYYQGWFYYGSDGKQVKYTGWKKLGGDWYYFNPDHTVFFGMAKDSVAWCYTRVNYDVDTERYSSELVTSEYVQVGSSLYYFDASGHAKKAISANGWYKAGNSWCYFESGALVGYGYREINGAGYYFYDGYMATEVTEYVDGALRYFDASGKMVTKQGWYQRDEDWIYVNADGEVYEHGIYKIGGKEYTFYWGVLVS